MVIIRVKHRYLSHIYETHFSPRNQSRHGANASALRIVGPYEKALFIIHVREHSYKAYQYTHVKSKLMQKQAEQDESRRSSN